MSKKKVLLAGLATSAVEFDKWPELTPEKLEAAFAMVKAELEEQGYSAKWCLTDSGATAEEQFVADLKAFAPDIVLIGAGVRSDPDHLELFEKLINAVLRESPSSKIAFNTTPFDSAEAIERWVS